MILFSDGDELVAITQADHAKFAMELLELWRGDGFPEHARRAEILFATREHDNGWREFDAAPRVSLQSGKPVDLFHVSDEQRQEIWRRGALRYRLPAFPALLVIQHALALHASHRAEPSWQAFFAELDELREAILVESSIAEPAIDGAYRWVELADALSLQACTRREQPLALAACRSLAVGSQLHLQPFPLAGATTFAVACRRIPDQVYSGDAAWGLALAQAKWKTLEIRVVP